MHLLQLLHVKFCSWRYQGQQSLHSAGVVCMPRPSKVAQTYRNINFCNTCANKTALSLHSSVLLVCPMD
eukprot:1789687-Amphidinium_carterae.2